MVNRYQCEACDGTGEAPEARPAKLSDLLEETAEDIEVAMHRIAKHGADFSVVLGDAITALRQEAMRLEKQPT